MRTQGVLNKPGDGQCWSAAQIDKAQGEGIFFFLNGGTKDLFMCPDRELRRMWFLFFCVYIL